MADERKETKLRISYELYEQVAAIAEKEKRSVNAQIEHFVSQGVLQYRPMVQPKSKRPTK